MIKDSVARRLAGEVDGVRRSEHAMPGAKQVVAPCVERIRRALKVDRMECCLARPQL